jgi:hypothetical protein
MNSMRRLPEMPSTSLSAGPSTLTGFLDQNPNQTGSFSLTNGTSIGRENTFLPMLVQDNDPTDTPSIKNVWFDNFETELPFISELLEKYPYVAMVSYLVCKVHIIGHGIPRNNI